MNNNILVNKNDNKMADKTFQRNNQINTQMSNHIFDRPQSSIETRDFKESNRQFNQFVLPQKVSLGYNDMRDQSKQSNNTMNKDFGSKISNRLFENVDDILPPNIYHNFATSTRDHKKEINYNISDRNDLVVEKTHF